MDLTIISITPQIAKSWIAKTSENKFLNRRIRMHKVEQFSRDMMNGKWLLTHQGIAIDRNGNVLDGQHRLHAICEADRTVNMVVAKNVNQDVYAVIDKGVPRSISDTLRSFGAKSPDAMASVIRWLANYERAIEEDAGILEMDSKRGQRSPSEQLTIYRSYENELREAYTVCRPLYDRTRLLPSLGIVMFCNIIFTELWDAEHAEEFLISVMTGKAVARSNAPTVLHVRVLRERTESHRRAFRKIPGPREILPYVFKAWNYYVLGKSISKVQYNKSIESEPMPIRYMPSNA